MKNSIMLLLAVMRISEAAAQSGDTTSNRLKEVVITAKEPVIRQEAGKIVYNLQSDPQSKQSSLLDMMRKVPMLSVDGADNVLLNGNPSYKIFINGRPSGIMKGNPKDILRSIPASTVQSIEVITNPPAKYDAEGLAGIINIVMIRQVHNGYRGSVNTNGKAPVGGPGGGGNFTIRQGKAILSAIAGANRYDAPETFATQQRTGTGPSPASLEQYTTDRNHGYTLYGGAEGSYEPDSLHLFTGEANVHRNNTAGQTVQTTTLTTAGDEQFYQLGNEHTGTGNGVDASLNYQQGFRNRKDRLLILSYRFSKETAAANSDIAFRDTINYAATDYRQQRSESAIEHSGQADYIQPIGKLVAEGGVKYLSVINSSAFQFENRDAATGIYETDETRSNTFSYTQQVLAAYNSYTYKRGNWQFKAGVRAENTFFKGSSRNTAPLQYSYLNVLPSVFISRDIRTGNSLSFSFSGRVQRPSAAELNPFMDRSNPSFLVAGNPYLRPITSNVFELSYLSAAKATLHVSAGAMFFHHVFNAFATYDTASHITITRNENYGKGRVLKANIFINYPAGNQWTFTLNSDIRYVTVQGIAPNGSSFDNAGMDVYIYASGACRFKNGWRVHTDITYKKVGLILPVGKTNGFAATSFSIHKSLLQSKLTVAVSVSNPFTRYRYADESINGWNFLQTSHKQVYFRQFAISLNYSFGRLKEDVRKSERSIGSNDH